MEVHCFFEWNFGCVQYTYVLFKHCDTSARGIPIMFGAYRSMLYTTLCATFNSIRKNGNRNGRCAPPRWQAASALLLQQGRLGWSVAEEGREEEEGGSTDCFFCSFPLRSQAVRDSCPFMQAFLYAFVLRNMWASVCVKTYLCSDFWD